MNSTLLTPLASAPDSPIAEPDRADVPRELLRLVAADLKALAKALPYDEYATIVYQIARVRWRCELAAIDEIAGREVEA